MGEGIVGEFGINMNTLLYFKQTSYKDLLCTAQGTLLCHCGSLDGRRVWGETVVVV